MHFLRSPSSLEELMERYICIHGHFYQPPRENAWLEHIEPQDSAYPFHDWNERIAAECYMPNGTSRILDGEGNVEKITNNYARISFNFWRIEGCSQVKKGLPCDHFCWLAKPTVLG